jgi:hypothetical protein
MLVAISWRLMRPVLQNSIHTECTSILHWPFNWGSLRITPSKAMFLERSICNYQTIQSGSVAYLPPSNPLWRMGFSQIYIHLIEIRKSPNARRILLILSMRPRFYIPKPGSLTLFPLRRASPRSPKRRNIMAGCRDQTLAARWTLSGLAHPQSSSAVLFLLRAILSNLLQSQLQAMPHPGCRHSTITRRTGRDVSCFSELALYISLLAPLRPLKSS